MRFSRKKNYKSWDRRTSLLAHAAKARKRMAAPVPQVLRPEIGLLLYTIRIESHLESYGFEIKIRQAKRLNQVTVETFGRQSKPIGLDCVAKHLRKKLVTRWTTQNAL